MSSPLTVAGREGLEQPCHLLARGRDGLPIPYSGQDGRALPACRVEREFRETSQRDLRPAAIDAGLENVGLDPGGLVPHAEMREEVVPQGVFLRA